MVADRVAPRSGCVRVTFLKLVFRTLRIGIFRQFRVIFLQLVLKSSLTKKMEQSVENQENYDHQSDGDDNDGNTSEESILPSDSSDDGELITVFILDNLKIIMLFYGN